MSSKLISTANPTVHIYSNNPNNQSSRTHEFPHLSFNPQLTNSRIRTGSGPPRPRPATRVTAFYAPAETKETLYELLGIGESVSSVSEIKKAYKQMARKYHPDVSPPERVDEYTRRFIMVHEAYETLSNPRTRALYDRDLAFAASDFSFSPRTQGVEEKDEWKSTWKSQLDELQRRDCREKDRMSWGARMRSS